jgi:ATP synthase protein I
MRNLITTQIVLIALAAVGFLAQAQVSSLAAIYGGGIVVVNGWLLYRRVARAMSMRLPDPRADVFSLYLGFVERLVFTLVALALGMRWLGLPPFPLLVGFVLGYLGNPLSRVLPDRVAARGYSDRPLQPKNYSE